MKNFLPILVVIGFSFLSCNKSGVDPAPTPSPSPDTTSVVVPQPKLIGADYFMGFVTQGQSHNLQRIDYLFNSAYWSNNTNDPLGLSWTRNRKPSDTLFYYGGNGAVLGFSLYYRDTTVETLSVNGTIQLGNLLSGYTKGDNYSGPLFYLRDSLHLPDTVSLAVVRVKNNTRSTEDTLYAYVSSKYVVITPTPFHIKDWQDEIIQFYSKLPLSKSAWQGSFYTTTDTVFVSGNKSYPAAYVQDAGKYTSLNRGAVGGSTRLIYLSTQNGLLHFYNAFEHQEMNYGFYNWKVTHNFIN